MDKHKNIYELAQESYKALSGGEWPDFLRFAAWNFRFRFPDQSLIYAQRPDVTSCYTFDEWNNRFKRRIRSKAKGIAILDDRKDQVSVSYLFDYKDTYSPEGKHLQTWEMTQDKEPAVRGVLINKLMADEPTITPETDTFEFYSSAVYMLLEDKLQQTIPDLLQARSTCRLRELNEEQIKDMYQLLLLNSATAIVLHRCGFDTELPDEAFADAAYFDSHEAMSILGNATQSISKQVLREVAMTIAAWDKEHQHEEEKEHEKQPDLSAGRGVSDPEPDRSNQSKSEQVRQNEEEVSGGEPGEPVHRPFDVRSADGASASDGSNDRTDDEQNHEGTAGEEPGAREGEGEPAVDAAHGDAEASSGGTGLSRDDLRLEQYFTEQHMTAVLLSGPNLEGGKFRIQKSAVEDQDKESFDRTLRKEYNFGGRSYVFEDGTRAQIIWDSHGIGFFAPGFNPASLSWSAVQTRIRDLVAADRYLDEQENIQYQRYFAEQEALHKRQELREVLRVFYSIYGPRDHDSIVQMDEYLRAFVYEHSETARTALLEAFSTLSNLPAVQGDPQTLSTITEALAGLYDNARTPDSPEPPSALDAGIKNPFPSEEELTLREEQQSKPLDRVPLDDIPDFINAADIVDAPAPQISEAEYAEGEVINLNGVEYMLLSVGDQTVTIQDVEHPLFTQELPVSVLRTLQANNSIQGNQADIPATTETEKEESDIQEPGQEAARTSDSIPVTPASASAENQQADPENIPNPSSSKGYAPFHIRSARNNYKQLENYAPYILNGELDYVRFESDTYEPLYIERVAPDQIAIAHTVEQGDGDIIVDPEIVFLVDDKDSTLRPISCQQPVFGGIIQHVYAPDDQEHRHPDLTLEHDINSLFRNWMQNLKWQDHTPVRGKKRMPEGDLEYTFNEQRQPVRLEHDEDVSETREDKAILSDLVQHFERWNGSPDIHLHGKYFGNIKRRISDIQVSDNAEENRKNILYAAYTIRHFFPLPDNLAERAKDTSRILTLADDYLDLVSSFEEMGNILRLDEWKNGCDKALFEDLCQLCAMFLEDKLPENIRKLVSEGYEPDFYEDIPTLANYLNVNNVSSGHPENMQHTFDKQVLAGLIYEEDRYSLYPERRQAEREQESGQTRTVKDVFEKFLNVVVSEMLNDTAFVNAIQNADEENFRIEGDAAVRRAVLAIGDIELTKLYFDMASFHNRMHQQAVEKARQAFIETHQTENRVRNPEPEIDHPELVTNRHFPVDRADKEMLADLLLFINDYRGTFKQRMPELSEHDQKGYDEISAYIQNFVVTDDIYNNVLHIKDAVNYIKNWFVPFSDNMDIDFMESLTEMLRSAEALNADKLYEEELSKQEAQAEAASEEVVPSAQNDDVNVSEPGVEVEEYDYSEASFHEGDFYEDHYTRGIITHVYVPEKGVPHESSFGVVDPEAPEDSRDAKGYVVSMPTAIYRLNRGEASLTPAAEWHQVEKQPNKANEPTLFDFEYEEPASASKPSKETAKSEIPQPVVVQASQGAMDSSERINFRMPDHTIPYGGPKARYQNNVAAIRLLKQLESEERLATAEEQEVLSKYVGWGGIQEAFDKNNASWSKEYDELRNLLNESEYSAARESTLTAFYTPPEVTDAIYKVLGNLGFERGNILDPGCGTGSFSGRLPEEMSDSKVYGVEKDNISGRIARQLYQKNNIVIEGYEKTKLPDNFFDVAVGNVPFGAFKVSDKRYDKLNLQIHDYFFAKTLDKVRPGGVIAFVTSMGTMDKQSTEFRRYLGQRADLLGAIRLPNNTFKTNAGTEVTSDIIFLQKREFPRVDEPEWVNLDRRYDYERESFGPETNAYFARLPEMVLGEMREVSGPHGPESACIAREGESLTDALDRAVKHIHGAILQPESGLYDQEYEERQSIPATPDVRNFSYTLVNDEIYFREDSEMFKADLGKKGEDRVRGLIKLRDIVHDLIDAQVNGAEDEVIRDLQRQLNDNYDAFVAKNGLINSRGNDMAFSDDSSYYLLCSLEHINEKGEFLGKADMFYKRTIRAHKMADHVDTAQEALAVSMGERGGIDFGFMTRLSGLSQEELVAQLQGIIFQDPTCAGSYEIAASYLSGNVRQKLAQARAAEEEEPGMWQANIQALEEVQPQDLEPADITVRLGSTWIPPEDYSQFMYELLDSPYWCRNGTVKVLYHPYTNTWNIKNVNYDDYNTKANTTYGTRRMHAYKIIENTLNLKEVKLFDTVTTPDGKERRVLNESDTMEAQEKQQLIKDAFKEWIWRDPDRAERLCKIYNERFNSFVPPKFDGSMVQFHNLNPNVRMRPWQRNAVARILYNGNTLLAHAVGAGKTWTMSAAAMEMKYLGLCNKSMIVVPNHLVGQWASAIYDQYPNAKVLASTKKDFETKNRKKFCSRIATGDYDVVVIGHSQFERIPLSEERQRAGIEKEIDKVIDAISELKAEKAENFTIKQMERTRKSLEARLEKLNNGKRRDDVITFEQLGIDRLFVDESHEYKNLFLFTKMQNVAGISQTDSQKASDMFLKCRYIDEMTGNKGNIHATGTPLSNTMAELYTTQRYLQHDLLGQMDLGAFDQWASTYGETVTSVELAPEGTGYRARTRFANFFNIPELMSIYCQVADIQTADMLDLPLPTPHYEVIHVPASDVQKDYVKGLGDRAQKIRNGSVRPEEDNMLCITNDGRKLALDQRLINPAWPDNPNSKVNACADNVYRIWNEYSETKGTQLVFCDISTPTNKTFNVYDDLKEKLVARGIPAEDIRFIHEANSDAQKEALFQQVREGKVRVLMGSTGKMGTGTNVQERLVAGHDLDCPWRPSDLEQRAGRVIRQGNTNSDVFMYRYVTEGTFDAYMYQLVENKQRFISQIFTSKPSVRQAADVDETVLSFAEIKALASGNPLIKERVELEGDIQRLQMLKSRHENAQYRINRRVTKELPAAIESLKKLISNVEKDVALIKSRPSRTPDGHFLPVDVKGVSYEKTSEAGAALLNAFKRAPENESTVIGAVRGFRLEADLTEKNFAGKIVPHLMLCGPGRAYSVGITDSEVGTITRLNNFLDNDIPVYLEEIKQRLSANEHDLESSKNELGKPFHREDELQEKLARLSEVTKQLDLDAKDEKKSSEKVHDESIPLDEPEQQKPKLSLDDMIRNAAVRQASQIHVMTDHDVHDHSRA